MCKLIKRKEKKTRVDTQIDEMQISIVNEIESAVKTLKDNRKLLEKTRFRPEDLAKVYNNEQLAILKLNCLASDLKRDTRQ